MEPRDAAGALERRRRLEDGTGERFAGYGALGLVFESGHVLACHRFTASSIGPPFASVWHRDPQSRWTVYTNVELNRSWPRDFGSAVHDLRMDDIGVAWLGARELSITARRARLHLALRLATTPLTKLLNVAARITPAALWSNAASLDGRTPAGHAYVIRPRRVWRVEAAAAVLDGRDLGGLIMPAERIALGDLVMPRTPLFGVVRVQQAVGPPDQASAGAVVAKMHVR